MNLSHEAEKQTKSIRTSKSGSVKKISKDEGLKGISVNGYQLNMSKRGLRSPPTYLVLASYKCIAGGIDRIFGVLEWLIFHQTHRYQKTIQKTKIICGEIPLNRFEALFLSALRPPLIRSVKTHDTKWLMKKRKHSEHWVLRARLPILRTKRDKAIIWALLFEVSEKFKVRLESKRRELTHSQPEEIFSEDL